MKDDSYSGTGDENYRDILPSQNPITLNTLGKTRRIFRIKVLPEVRDKGFNVKRNGLHRKHLHPHERRLTHNSPGENLSGEE
ncbi:hypothetical protein Tco_0034085 [Tanacetum coccineum]